MATARDYLQSVMTVLAPLQNMDDDQLEQRRGVLAELDDIADELRDYYVPAEVDNPALKYHRV